MKKCPKCGSKRIAPILYGMPAFNEEMEQKLNDERLYLGGCCITNANPTFHCFECKNNVGSPPILIGKNGDEDYREIVTSVRFYDGCFFNGYPELLIVKNKDSITLGVSPGFQNPEAVLNRSMKTSEWKDLMNRLFSEMFLHEWKKNYSNLEILDGEQWGLELKLTGGRVRNYAGSNALPPYWTELKNTFRPFFSEAGIEF